MARRRGMMTALQAALAGVAGGIEGRVQQQTADEERSRVAAALARQKGMDTMALEDRKMAKEDREQAKADRLQAQRAALLKGGYVPKGMDMPGATPRKAVSTEMVGAQEYNLYSTPRQMAMQAAMEEAELKAKFKPKDELTAWQKQQIAEQGLDRASREKIAAGRTQRGTGVTAAKTRDAMRTAEAWFNAPNNNPAQVKLARDIFVALRESRPDAPPQEIMLDAYNAVNAQMKMENTAAQTSQRQRSNPPKSGGRTLSNPPGMKKPAAENDIFDTEWEKYNKGGK